MAAAEPATAISAAVLAVFWALAIAWLIGRAQRQRAIYDTLWPAPPGLAGDLPAIDVVVPARNEADAIATCLAGLAAQDYPSDRLRVIFVDDGSSDGTAARARAAVGTDPRFTIAEAGPLPQGWMGKSHACAEGARRGATPWLCFIDADTHPAPALLRSALARAQADGIDFLSLQPRQVLITVWERMIIPSGLCVLGFTGDLQETADPQRAAAAVNGQFLLVRRTVYERAGGHAAVRAEVAEDNALALRVKTVGGRIAVLGGAPVISARMYRSLPQLWEGIAKNVTETFGGIGRTALLVVLGVIAAWAAVVIPLLLGLLAARSGWAEAVAFALALSASLAALGLHVAAARYFAIPWWYGALFPLAYTLTAILAVYGIVARWRGQVTWKGRVYPAARQGAAPPLGR